jgi:hypothetical protein
VNPGRQSSQRATLHVDVGPELSARVRAAAAAGGRTPSEWTRELLQRELAHEAAPVGTGPSPAHPGTELTAVSRVSPAAAGRLVLDAELASLLQQVQMQGQFRTRPAALRLVLRHFIGQGPTPAAEPIDATPLKDGVAALMRSNHELLPIGKNINQIAKALNAMQGGFRNADTRNLQVFAQAVRDHVEQAARVVSAIRVLVTPHKEKP